MQTELQPVRTHPRFVYADVIELRGDDILLLDTIKEFIIGIGTVVAIKKSDVHARIEFEFEAMSDEPNDLWTICERAHELAHEINSWGIHYVIDRTRVKKRKGANV